MIVRRGHVILSSHMCNVVDLDELDRPYLLYFTPNRFFLAYWIQYLQDIFA